MQLRRLLLTSIAALVLLAPVAPAAAGVTTIGSAPAASPARSVTRDIEAAFRDFPASASRGSTVTVRVDVPSGSTCRGTVDYRGDLVWTLDPREAPDGQCRWDIVVPNDAERGNADVSVTIARAEEELVLTAAFVVLGGDRVEASFRELPASARRGDRVDIRVDVSEDATCQGTITFRDGDEQSLDSQGERREQCRWDARIPEDARRGTAIVRVTVQTDEGQTTLAASFQVGSRESEAEIAAGFRDLPATVRRDDALPIRVVVPAGATCQGAITYPDDRTQPLEARTASGEECRWDVVVPIDARRGDADLSVTVAKDGDQTTLEVSFEVRSRGETLQVSFRDFPASAQRGEEVDIRVDVPEEVTCRGVIVYRDREEQALESQGERRDRCRWTIRVPEDARRGRATVRVTVTGDDDATTTIAAGFEVVANDNDNDD
jgi:hypothetical protein